MKNEATASNLIVELEARCHQLEQQNTELSAKLKWFEEQFRLSKKRQFGASSEKSDSTQLSLFNEAEAEAQPLLAEPTLEKITYQRKKQRGHREAMLKDLPVEIIEYYPTKEEQACKQCGNQMHEMKMEVQRELIIIPAQVKVLEQRQHIFACRTCQQEDIKTPIVRPKTPNPVFKGSLASPSTMAYVMNQKYVDALPLYRQEQQFARLGIEISRQNLANWVLHGADKWLINIYNRMHQLLLQQDILHADETNLQVLREPGRPAQTKSWLWLYRTGRAGPPIVLYDYQETRGREHPKQFLEGFRGYLHVDGYASYHAVEQATLVGCWAHARRYFDEALKALKPEKRNSSVPSRRGLDFCNRLFAIERDLKKATPEERYKARLERSRPVLDAFLVWLNEQAPKTLPKTAFGKAITYCLNQWSKLEAFMQDGRLEISNNLSERSIKPVVIGRKNFLFCNTPRGARSSAIIYSIVESAKQNGLNPFEYLKCLFEKLPNMDLSDLALIDKLLPHSDALPAICRIK